MTAVRETLGRVPGRQLYFAVRFSSASVAHALYNLKVMPRITPSSRRGPIVTIYVARGTTERMFGLYVIDR